jgi:hypothetical protein
MNGIVDDILEILQGNELIQNTRVVDYDETPAGRLEAKLRSQLPKDHTLQIWIHLEPETLDYAYQLLRRFLSCAGTTHRIREIFPTPRIIFTMRTAKYPIRR